jgi:3-phenylpropionate/trans-cinnamate dioxygenase ferredoxin reductase component
MGEAPTMGTDETFVIVGASLAGAKAAETLRTEGFTGRVVLVGAEASPPYERPPLSKGYLLGNEELEKAFVHDRDWYDQQDIRLLLGVRATAIDPAGHVVTLDGTDSLRYHKLLLTTGSRVRTIPVAGVDLDGVRSLRTIEESTELRSRLVEGAQVVIIGAGWIGLEVAAAARQAGCSVTVVEVDALPLRRVLGDEVAAIYRELHEAHGVSFRFGSGVTEIGSSAGELSHVVLDDGTELPADTVLIAVGITPNVELAAAAGLAIDSTVGGIVVDEYLCTSDPDIFAAGDCAAFWSPLLGARIRVEHWANALNGGPAAALCMLGRQQPYDRVPYFYTDQYTASPLISMEYGGYVAPRAYDRVVFRGSPAIRPDGDAEFIAFWTKEGRVLAGMNVNIWDVQDQIEPLVRAGYAGVAVDLERLADPAVPLTELLPHHEHA